MKQLLVIVGLFSLISTYAQSDTQQVVKNPIHQLRIYELPKENEQAFHDRFRDHAYRIMKKYHFNILAMWKSNFYEKAEFVYLLEWENETTMKSAWDKFLADQEWKNIKAETAKLHGAFVQTIQDRTLILTNYSPREFLSSEK